MRISIVTPNYNQHDYLEEAMASVLESGRNLDLEYIVVDGWSTDGSREVIERHAKDLAFWCSEPDAGQYDAVNKGLQRATGEILGWLNSDDRYFPWTLRTVHSIFAAFPDLEWLTTCQPGSLNAGGSWIGFRNVPGYCAEAFEDRCYIPVDDGVSFGAIQQESTFWRRSLWTRSGASLDISYRLAGDYELWSRFFRLAPLFAVDVPLAAYRCRPGQRGEDVAAYMREVDRVQGSSSYQRELRGRVARLPGGRGIMRRWRRYQAPVLSGSADGSEWNLRQVRFG